MFIFVRLLTAESESGLSNPGENGLTPAPQTCPLFALVSGVLEALGGLYVRDPGNLVRGVQDTGILKLLEGAFSNGVLDHL